MQTEQVTSMPGGLGAEGTTDILSPSGEGEKGAQGPPKGMLTDGLRCLGVGACLGRSSGLRGWCQPAAFGLDVIILAPALLVNVKQTLLP